MSTWIPVLALAAHVGCSSAAVSAGHQGPLGGGAGPTSSPPAPPGPIRHVVLVTIDGLLPESYLRPDAHGLRVPNLRRMVQQGAVSEGARSVFPTVTYPAHTSIATGVSPLRHGIHANRADDPLETNLDGWRWYAEDIAAPTIWQVAAGAGYRTALVGWPVTVGASATFLVPEVWRAKHGDDRKLLRALSTPGLLDAVGRADPSFWSRHAPGDFFKDQFLTDIAVYLLASGQPHLTLLHLVEVDVAQHKYGLFSAEAVAAIENADHQLGRLIDAAAGAGLWEATALVVASDHGFAPVSTMVRPGVVLREAGLVSLNEQGRVTDYRAFLQTSGGLGYVYLKEPGDAAVAATVQRAFAARSGPGGSIGRLFTPAQIRAAGGDPRAVLAFEAAPGASFGPGYLGEYAAPPIYRATHGFSPERPDMQASLLALGPKVPPGRLAGARLVDIAPTIARWLGMPMTAVEGRPLVTPSGGPP
jgi:predicted AlkP superfamily pyrophosphatase or phosphodiesterase